MATGILVPILLLVLVSSTAKSAEETYSFSYKKFEHDQPDLIFQGDATVSKEGKLALTKLDQNELPAPGSTGRVLHKSPIHVHDGHNAASWSTFFTFIINVPVKNDSADGLAFFLAPVGSEPQSPAGYLGLFNDPKADKDLQTVAVELDTYSNDWDPQNRHIGIDVNSPRSIKAASWGLANGQVGTVLVTYTPSTKLLVASLVHPSRRTSYIVSEIVDLPRVLPEYVQIGFSATTGEIKVESHDILSWSFTSTFSDTDTEPHLAM
ncbi:hypothetical protein RJT34_24096 [Clitoria ternatea]|uniref:Legume lectin domain-containing protein n=1 Tax=Clitoria ternatea TaxID=43366 RepID=A0AAN9IFK4_CLITE